MKTDLFQSHDHCWVFQICWHIECFTFTASSFRIWNISTGIPSPPLALLVVKLSLTQWNFESWCVGLPKRDRSWWRVLTKHDQLEKGMGSHVSILALRNPWMYEKNKVYLSKFKFVGNCVHPLFHARVITHLWQTAVANFRSEFKKRIKVWIRKVK